MQNLVGALAEFDTFAAKAFVLRTIGRAKGDVTRAAGLMKMSSASLQHWITKLELNEEVKELLKTLRWIKGKK